MIKNMSSTDRIIRLTVAVIIGILFFTNQITDIAAIVLGIIAVIFVATSFVSFCPIYYALKISTKKNTGAASPPAK